MQSLVGKGLISLIEVYSQAVLFHVVMETKTSVPRNSAYRHQVTLLTRVELQYGQLHTSWPLGCISQISYILHVLTGLIFRVHALLFGGGGGGGG